jgi:hypothetical protein
MADPNEQRLNPVTLADLAREGRLLWCYCLQCGHEREVDPLSLGLDPAEGIPTVGRRLTCSRCGSREIETRPQLHVEPLDVMRARFRGRPI